jgi:hypothetical protein
MSPALKQLIDHATHHDWLESHYRQGADPRP